MRGAYRPRGVGISQSLMMTRTQEVTPRKTEGAASASSRLESWIRRHFQLTAIAVLIVGLALRLREAWGTFLNPDEALHYFIANRNSWALAYQGSLTMAHPPLMVFVLHWWRILGTSEFMLRMPAVLAGTAFCWMLFQWLTMIFGRDVGMFGLLFSALLPAMVSLSAEVRQYEFLLLFQVSAAYFLELAFRDRSPAMLLVSAVFLYLAMLSHYSAFLFVAAFDVYSVWYLLRQFSARQFGRGMLVAWLVMQIGAVGISVILYVTQISKVKETAVAEQAVDTWLSRSYFHPGHGSWLLFVVARTFSVFQYIFEQAAVGDIATLIFVAGVIWLARGRIRPTHPGPSPRQIATFLVLPFVLNCVVALADLYPYGGTRHAAFLVIFALAGISLGIARIAAGRTGRAVALAVLIVLLCAFVRPRHPRYFTRAEHSREQMDRALAFIRTQIPVSDPIFADYETSLTLSYYLCAHKPVAYDDSIASFVVFHCDGRRIISTVPDQWTFLPDKFPGQWNELVRNGRLAPGETVWVGEAGWLTNLASGLQHQSPQFQGLQTYTFGPHIQFFKLTVGQAIPATAVSH